MKKLLTIKHWQLFLLLIVVPFVAQILVMLLFVLNDDPDMFFVGAPIMMVLFAILYFGWFYTLGNNLHKKLPPEAPMNLRRFRVFFIIPVVYFFLILCLMIPLMTRKITGINPMLFVLILPLHLFSMFCIFYCLYFNARALRSVESQMPVRFSDFAGEFFLLWFFPIGIWFLQPRINRLFDPRAGIDDIHILDSRI